MKREIRIFLLIAAAIILFTFFMSRSNPAYAATAASIESGFGEFIKYIAGKYGVPWKRVAAQVFQESHGDPGAEGKAGERGLMQIKPDALTDVNDIFGLSYTFDEMYDAGANIEVGTAYLAVKLREVRAAGLGDIDEATQAYNAGFRAFSLDRKKGAPYLALVKEKESFF